MQFLLQVVRLLVIHCQPHCSKHLATSTRLDAQGAVSEHGNDDAEGDDADNAGTSGVEDLKPAINQDGVRSPLELRMLGTVSGNKFWWTADAGAKSSNPFNKTLFNAKPSCNIHATQTENGAEDFAKAMNCLKAVADKVADHSRAYTGMFDGVTANPASCELKVKWSTLWEVCCSSSSTPPPLLTEACAGTAGETTGSHRSFVPVQRHQLACRQLSRGRTPDPR